jgi:hypothetical protein
MDRRSWGAVLLLCTSHVVAAAEPANAIDVARTKVRARLRSPACRMLLSSYTDASGRSLMDNLTALEAGPEQYVGWLLFRPAPSGARACAEPSNVFFTTPGSRVVFTCGERFATLHASDPDLAASLVLHEMLHSLGLGENPPSPSQITSRVVERCR